MPNNVYSIDSYREREIGVWLNNKPLYQMDIKINMTITESPSFFDTVELLNQLEILTSIEGISYNNNLGRYITYSNQTYSPKVTYDIDTHYIKIEFSTSSIEALTNTTISLYYTKTQLRKMRTSSLLEESGEYHPVEDVKVNGVSVIDSVRVAQIKSYKEITQAEYNALPDTKKSDGIMYCIIDSSTPEDKGVIDVKLDGISAVDQYGVANLTGLATAAQLALKQNLLVAGNNIALTQLQDGTVQISASGGSGDGGVTDVIVNGVSVVSNGVATFTVPTNIPTQTSQLINNSGFITVSVNNLTNYDTKTQVDNKISQAINAIPVVSTQTNGLMTPTLKALAENAVKDVKVNDVSVVDANGIAQISVSGGSTYAAGEGIDIANNTISARRMTGATTQAAGAAGIVPPPASSQRDKFLRGDGTWAQPTVDMSSKQNVLTPSTGITIVSDVISAPAMTGANSQADGEMGIVPKPFIADRNKFLRGDGAWANVSDINDVNVNGVSVVDTNKVAQIISYKEVTQAQYDALSASKLNDGILYCIKDAGIVEGDKYAPIIYSLEEREIGVWTDGKPLYQKTLIYNAQTSGTIPAGETDLVYFADAADVMVINYESCAINKINGRAYKLAYFDSNNSASTYIVYNVNDNGYFTARVRNDSWGANYIFVITVHYTKTIDVPGSGQWGINGVPMIHYDGTEKIIGTWFGETLYQKTIEITSAVTIPASQWGTIYTNSFIGEIKQITFSALQNTTNGGYYDCAYYRTSGNNLEYYFPSTGNFTINAGAKITIQYTKIS